MSVEGGGVEGSGPAGGTGGGGGQVEQGHTTRENLSKRPSGNVHDT
jgi:hypothetical protein